MNKLKIDWSLLSTVALVAKPSSKVITELTAMEATRLNEIAAALMASTCDSPAKIKGCARLRSQASVIIELACARMTLNKLDSALYRHNGQMVPLPRA